MRNGTEPEYRFSLYSPNLLLPVADLLQHLWGKDTEGNRAYFKWKYAENPYARIPLGVTAAVGDRIVGFRGYFATRWHIPGKNIAVTVLNPGDTVVHPDHRMKGLSVKMGRLAMAAYGSEYDFFFNHSASAKSAPGYLRMGFFPLLPKVLLSRYSPAGLMHFLYMARFRPKAPLRRIDAGDDGTIFVEHCPRPAEMAELIAGLPTDRDRITLWQDETFFNWRYGNRRNKYVFYYRTAHDRIAAFLVIRVSPNGLRGYICDWAAKDNRDLAEILAFAVREKHFDVLSIYDLNLPPDLLDVLASAGFRRNGMLRRIERRRTGEWPLFIRPVQMAVSETDWRISGLDARLPENWEIKEICSDSS